MGAFGMESDRKAGATGHHRFGAYGNLTRKVIGIVVDSGNGLDAFDRARLHHRLRSFPHLLRRLEYQVYGSAQGFPHLMEFKGGAQQCGHMNIVSAGMHVAPVQGMAGILRFLEHRQTVDVRAQRDVRPLPFTGDAGEHTAVKVDITHRDTVVHQLLSQECTGFVLLERQLGCWCRYLRIVSSSLTPPVESAFASECSLS